MNRRGFIGALLGAVAAVVGQFGFSQSKIVGWKAAFSPTILNDRWVCVVHPSTEQDIRNISARCEWDAAWHHARKIGIAREATPQHVLHVFREYDPFAGAAITSKSTYRVDDNGFGHYDNIRWIASPT